jgi:hypothetical protein
MEANWKPAGSHLEANWKPTGSRMEADWKPHVCTNNTRMPDELTSIVHQPCCAVSHSITPHARHTPHTLRHYAVYTYMVNVPFTYCALTCITVHIWSHIVQPSDHRTHLHTVHDTPCNPHTAVTIPSITQLCCMSTTHQVTDPTTSTSPLANVCATA